MKAKKTIEVMQVLEYANKQLRRTDEYADKKFKAGICLMIEEILYRSGNYNGYFELDGSEYTNEYCRTYK